ncbi:helix-turn-helix transcriptional regulator [Porcincola intestinalis]|uniref:helix-turn-helix transcriptional regulator n=1 Tax=Porcincola intestinalis TaxID=2606632 RepID=UPI002E2620A6|nr:helix-turn-helix domain-containing protein [Lachnospiraceae bacterium]
MIVCQASEEMLLDLSQSDVAKALHVTRGFISNVENGRVNMAMRLMVYYARPMHVSLDEIVGLTDKQYLSTALDHEIMEEVSQLSLEEKHKLLTQLRTDKKNKEAKGEAVTGVDT